MSAPQQNISQNKALLWFMGAACGLCAGANYYSQPLIHSIQQFFAVTEGQAALTVTFAQVSYALGLLFIVPLGDVVNKTNALDWNHSGWVVFCCCSGFDSPRNHDC